MHVFCRSPSPVVRCFSVAAAFVVAPVVVVVVVNLLLPLISLT